MKKSINKSKLLTFFSLNLSALFLLLLYSNIQVLAQPIDPPGLENAKSVQEAHTPNLLDNPEVVGTAVGLDDNGEPVIKVFVLTEQFRGIPQSLEGFPVEVEVTGMFVALTDPTAWQPRPVPIGVSTGHPDITAGTIGCRVKDAFGFVYALSNNHIYANTNEASIGDSALQPGPYDGGSDPVDKIGELYDFEPIDFSGGDNTIDAAIALSSTAVLGYSTPTDDGYGNPSSTTAAAYIDQLVMKYGRTTGLTEGKVDSINATVNVCYKCGGGPFCFKCNKLAKFVDQIVITPGSFSAGGDSGSLIVTNDANNNPVGLLFAGSSSYTIANPIDPVLIRFNVTIDNVAADGCEFDADCDDGDACNGTETCGGGGSCQVGTPVNCDDSNACTADSCNPATGLCSNDSISCDDGNLCTTDSCDTATGCLNTLISCDDGNACTTDSCAPATGSCSNDPISCDDGSACTNDSCNPATGCEFVDNGTCICLSVGMLCTGNAECCSNKCRGKPGNKTCK